MSTTHRGHCKEVTFKWSNVSRAEFVITNYLRRMLKQKKFENYKKSETIDLKAKGKNISIRSLN